MTRLVLENNQVEREGRRALEKILGGNFLSVVWFEFRLGWKYCLSSAGERGETKTGGAGAIQLILLIKRNQMPRK